MKIDVQKYCNLARAADFQEWLKAVSAELYTELIDHLKLGKDCGSNKNKMMIIHDKLKQRKLAETLIDFLTKKYPYMLINDKQDVSSVTKKVDLKPDEINVHKVFPLYRPLLFMMPQQYIFLGADYVEVNNKIINFVRTKVSTDYIILKSDMYFHGYVEYFDRKYASEVANVPRDKRPIALYRAKYGIK